MKDLWNARYIKSEYVYGEEPNAFFKHSLDLLPAGELLLPGEGEGRNAVYAAQRGWMVDAFDLSSIACKKALTLARKKKVNITYRVSEFTDISSVYTPQSFDAIAVIFVHLPIGVRSEYFGKLLPLLKPGGYFILEVFSKEQLAYQDINPQAGGPPYPDLLYSEEEVAVELIDLETKLLLKKEVHLDEGSGHQGAASVIQYIGIKK